MSIWYVYESVKTGIPARYAYINIKLEVAMKHNL